MKFKFFKILLLVGVGISALSWVVMSLWNWIMPSVFAGVNQIDYWHAMGLLVLSRILFGGFRGKKGYCGHHHREHWESMTEEEREKFKGRCMFRSMRKS